MFSTITPLVHREATLEEEAIQTNALVQRSCDCLEAVAEYAAA
jgi:hypothetical protein